MIILLTGRYAGKKAVIIRNHDDGTPNRKYGHAEVLVLTKEPRKVSCEIEGLRSLYVCSLQSFFWNFTQLCLTGLFGDTGDQEELTEDTG